MAELFGFKITRSGQDGGSDGFTAPASDDGTLDIVSGGGHYASVLDLDGRDTSDIELIKRYRDIARRMCRWQQAGDGRSRHRGR